MAEPLPPGAEQLYEAPFEDFVAERARLAKQLRAAGDRAGAAQVAALRKPTAVAWALNRLAHAEPGLVNKLAQCAGRLRQAHGEGGDELRNATQTYRDAMREVIAAARAEGPGGRPLSEPLAERLRATLMAAAADPELAEVVRAGRLVEEVEGAVMFGGAAPAPATPPPRAKRAPSAPAERDRSAPATPPPRPKRAASARRRGTAAGEEEARAEAAAEAAAARAAAEAEREAAARAELERRRAALRHELEAAVGRHDEARAAVAAARETLDAAKAAGAEADAEVERLQGELDALD